MSADITTYTSGNESPAYSIAGNLLLNKLVSFKNHLLQAKDITSNPTTTTLNADNLQNQAPQWGQPGYVLPEWGTPERMRLNALDPNQFIIGGE